MVVRAEDEVGVLEDGGGKEVDCEVGEGELDEAGAEEVGVGRRAGGAGAGG